MAEPTREPFLIGGMDADIEDLLLSAGGEFISPQPAPVEAAGPAVLLAFAPSRRLSLDAARDAFRANGWLISTPDPGGDRIAVPERCVVRALHRLNEMGAAPDRVVVRSVDVLPAQVKGIREALGPGTSLEITT